MPQFMEDFNLFIQQCYRIFGSAEEKVEKIVLFCFRGINKLTQDLKINSEHAFLTQEINLCLKCI